MNMSGGEARNLVHHLDFVDHTGTLRTLFWIGLVRVKGVFLYLSRFVDCAR